MHGCVKINSTCTRCVVCHSAPFVLPAIVSQSLDPRALQNALCTHVVHHWYHYVLYVHLYFNTVPQIVEEQDCFQTLWKSKRNNCCNQLSNHIVKQNHSKTIVLFTGLSKSKLSSVQKRFVHCPASFIVAVHLHCSTRGAVLLVAWSHWQIVQSFFHCCSTSSLFDTWCSIVGGVVSLADCAALFHLVIAEFIVGIVHLIANLSLLCSSHCIIIVSIIAFIIVLIINFFIFDLCIKDPLFVIFVSAL